MSISIFENPATNTKPRVDQTFSFEAGPACQSEFWTHIGMRTVYVNPYETLLVISTDNDRNAGYAIQDICFCHI